MKSNLLFGILVVAVLSGCSILKRDSSYEDSGSVKDLSVPPELVLPKRDENYSIPDEPEQAVSDAVEEAVEEVVEEAVESAPDGG